MGKIVENLKKNNIEDNTIIVFLSGKDSDYYLATTVWQNIFLDNGSLTGTGKKIEKNYLKSPREPDDAHIIWDIGFQNVLDYKGTNSFIGFFRMFWVLFSESVE